MKLSNIRFIGRFINPETGNEVNIHRGNRVGRGTDHNFWLLRGKRNFVSEGEFYQSWKRV